MSPVAETRDAIPPPPRETSPASRATSGRGLAASSSTSSPRSPLPTSPPPTPHPRPPRAPAVDVSRLRYALDVLTDGSERTGHGTVFLTVRRAPLSSMTSSSSSSSSSSLMGKEGRDREGERWGREEEEGGGEDDEDSDVILARYAVTDVGPLTARLSSDQSFKLAPTRAVFASEPRDGGGGAGGGLPSLLLALSNAGSANLRVCGPRRTGEYVDAMTDIVLGRGRRHPGVTVCEVPPPPPDAAKEGGGSSLGGWWEVYEDEHLVVHGRALPLVASASKAEEEEGESDVEGDGGGTDGDDSRDSSSSSSSSSSTSSSSAGETSESESDDGDDDESASSSDDPSSSSSSLSSGGASSRPSHDSKALVGGGGGIAYVFTLRPRARLDRGDASRRPFSFAVLPPRFDPTGPLAVRALDPLPEAVVASSSSSFLRASSSKLDDASWKEVAGPSCDDVARRPRSPPLGFVLYPDPIDARFRVLPKDVDGANWRDRPTMSGLRVRRILSRIADRHLVTTPDRDGDDGGGGRRRRVWDDGLLARSSGRSSALHAAMPFVFPANGAPPPTMMTMKREDCGGEREDWGASSRGEGEAIGTAAAGAPAQRPNGDRATGRTDQGRGRRRRNGEASSSSSCVVVVPVGRLRSRASVAIRNAHGGRCCCRDDEIGVIDGWDLRWTSRRARPQSKHSTGETPTSRDPPFIGGDEGGSDGRSNRRATDAPEAGSYSPLCDGASGRPEHLRDDVIDEREIDPANGENRKNADDGRTHSETADARDLPFRPGCDGSAHHPPRFGRDGGDNAFSFEASVDALRSLYRRRFGDNGVGRARAGARRGRHTRVGSGAQWDAVVHNNVISIDDVDDDTFRSERCGGPGGARPLSSNADESEIDLVADEEHGMGGGERNANVMDVVAKNDENEIDLDVEEDDYEEEETAAGDERGGSVEEGGGGAGEAERPSESAASSSVGSAVALDARNPAEADGSEAEAAADARVPHLLVLGTGCASPSPWRGSSGYALLLPTVVEEVERASVEGRQTEGEGVGRCATTTTMDDRLRDELTLAAVIECGEGCLTALSRHLPPPSPSSSKPHRTATTSMRGSHDNNSDDGDDTLRERLRQIRLVWISHGHLDHYGGLPCLVRAIRDAGGRAGSSCDCGDRSAEGSPRRGGRRPEEDSPASRRESAAAIAGMKRKRIDRSAMKGDAVGSRTAIRECRCTPTPVVIAPAKVLRFLDASLGCRNGIPYNGGTDDSAKKDQKRGRGVRVPRGGGGRRLTGGRYYFGVTHRDFEVSPFASELRRIVFDFRLRRRSHHRRSDGGASSPRNAPFASRCHGCEPYRPFRLLRSVQVEHCPQAHGLLLGIDHDQDASTEYGGSGLGTPVDRTFFLCYSGDTRPSASLLRCCRDTVGSDFGRRVSLLIHEATFDDDERGVAEAQKKRHSTVSEALDVANRMDAESCLLTHFSQRYPCLPPGAVIDRRSSEDDRMFGPPCSVRRGTTAERRSRAPLRRDWIDDANVCFAADGMILPLTRLILSSLAALNACVMECLARH